MDHERFQRVAELFEQGCRMPPERREAWLRQSAGDDESLCAELRQLLAADARRAAEPDDDPLARAARRVTAEALDALAEETLPRRLGRFAIEAVLGAGTSGVVFRARGDGESVDVALKVLHGGAGSARAHQRFRNEAHILARLRHAGIVRVTDSGVVAWAGRQAPYLAMELVEGERLDAWARDHRPPPAARLAVLRDVARAVDHAHGHGVVHRDLKPANVLVRPDGSPCVVDFGIAHALAALDLTTLETASGQLLGTLAYMSPEQVSGERNVGPASDVYALAALLHELLMGAPPLDVRGLTLPAAARRVSEGVPPQLQALRDAHGLALGSVVERALRRDPSERHATAGAFADELQRLLDGGLSVEPVHPRSVGAHAVAARRGPALSRHLPAATALAAAALIAWAWSARPPGTAHTAGVPERVADRAPASGFRVAGAHSVLTPHDGGQRQRLVQAATPGQLSRIAELRRLDEVGGLSAATIAELSENLVATGDWDAAIALERRMLANAVAREAGSAVEVKQSTRLGWLLLASGREAEAEALFARARALQPPAGPVSPAQLEARVGQGCCLSHDASRRAESERLILDGERALEAALGADDARTQRALRCVVALLEQLGRQDEADRQRARLVGP